MSEISRHAKKRIAERCGKVSKRMAELALTRGTVKDEIKGSLRRYLDWVWHQGDCMCRIIVYANQVFFFDADKDVLVTVYTLPVKYQRYLRNLKTKHDAE